MFAVNAVAKCRETGDGSMGVDLTGDMYFSTKTPVVDFSKEALGMILNSYVAFASWMMKSGVPEDSIYKWVQLVEDSISERLPEAVSKIVSAE